LSEAEAKLYDLVVKRFIAVFYPPAEFMVTTRISTAKVDAKEVTEVILGQILTAGAGQNAARQAAVNAGIPVEKTAYAINQLCGSGLRAVALGFDRGRGDAWPHQTKVPPGSFPGWVRAR